MISYEAQQAADLPHSIDKVAQYPESSYMRAEANNLLSQYSQISDYNQRALASQNLADARVLPGLALSEADRLDVVGEKDGITKEDLSTILEDRTGKYDYSTRLAAAYVKENFEGIEESTTSLWGWDTIDKDELSAWKEVSSEEGFEDKAVDIASINPNHDDSQSLFYPPQESLDAASLPDSAPGSQNDVARQILTAQLNQMIYTPGADPKAILETVQQLANNGVERVALKDRSGQEFMAEIKTSPVAEGSDKQYVHLFTQGPDGKSRIIVRGIDDNGVFVPERNKDGETVSFYGRKWAKDNGLLV